jgi:hypothetical protein
MERFFSQSRKQCINAMGSNGKSGVAQWSLRFPLPLLKPCLLPKHGSTNKKVS